MTRTLFFADKALIFTSGPESAAADLAAAGTSAGAAHRMAWGPDVCRTKIVEIFERCNAVTIACADDAAVEAAFEAFAREFACVAAAGGVAIDAGGRCLMICRNGRWDLPKGHLEAGETLGACACREVQEETGIAVELVRPLCRTWHAYWFQPTQRWELKSTDWFEMRPADGASRPVPQTEEGISQVGWIAPHELDDVLRGTYPTIRCVFDALRHGTQSTSPA